MKTLECSHATGAHNVSCDLVAGLEKESAGRLKTLLEKAEEANRAWKRAENAEGRVAELVRCLSHERCSVCGQLYQIDPTAVDCCLADHVEAYAAIIGKS